MKDRQNDIVDMVERLEQQAPEVVGAIMITFSKDGNTFIDHSCNLTQLASAIASLQAQYTNYYNQENSLN